MVLPRRQYFYATETEFPIYLENDRYTQRSLEYFESFVELKMVRRLRNRLNVLTNERILHLVTTKGLARIMRQLFDRAEHEIISQQEKNDRQTKKALPANRY
jgi:hypothetical protein